MAPLRPLAAALALALLSTAGLAGPAGALDGPASPDPTVTEPSTTVPDSSTTTTGVPDATDPTVAPTTVPPGNDPGDGPQYQNDDDLVGRGFYAGQGAFDPAAKLALPGDVTRAQRILAAAQSRQATAAAALAAAQQQVADLQARLALLEAGQRQAVEDAAKAKSAFVDRAVSAYMHGRESESFALLESKTPIEYERRTQMLGAVLDADVDVAAEYQRQRESLGGELETLLDDLQRLNQQVTSTQFELLTAASVTSAADWQVRTFQNGSQLWVPGFVFPVAGPVQFVDSFGYPRLLGTGQQHWHEGCDVMSPMGTPLVAAEDGVVTKVGENSLGGLSLKITGASGYWYYYAHLSAFAPGLVAGMPIAAGALVGYVGNTGDASGGPTHLHFEVHRPDGKVLDSFGLLKTAWQARQEQLLLGGTDPVSPPDPATHPDPGLPGGFPRFADGRPVFADPSQQPVIDPSLSAAPDPVGN